MSKVKVTKDGVTREVKERYLHGFIAKGWVVDGGKKVSNVGKAKATADVIEEVIPPKQEEEESSMPNEDKGEE